MKDEKRRAPNKRYSEEEFTPRENVVAGRNAVRELFADGRTVDKLLVQTGAREGSVIPLIAQARERGIPVIDTDKRKLDELAGGGFHQGVIALTAAKEYCSVDDIITIARERGEQPLILVLDGVEDPRNLGAIIRCAEGAGAHGVIISKRHSAGLSPVAVKTSAGALEHMAVAKVSNIAACVEDLKEKGIWTFCADMDGERYDSAPFDRACAIILGNEGEGVSRLVKEKCDYTVSIPMYGKISSLNVSASAGILLYAAKLAQSKL